MEIPNLNPNPQVTSRPVFKISLTVIFLLLIFSLATGFWLSRLMPFSKNSSNKLTLGQPQSISTDTISSASQIQIDKLYGDTNTTFKDSATGTIEKGSINGVGTHILNRSGGASQRASLTSSVVDLDLFIGRKVEVKGETNSSPKTAWLMDVGSVKVLE
ncbi:MAG: hypothetical protein WC784_00715 [Candidatus Shapirobacteria bacterium]|jgi:hypothetical protein